MATKTIYYDGKKAVTLTGDEGWTNLSGEDETRVTADKFYSTIAMVYRCVNMRANGVSSMPFVIKRGEAEVYEFDGTAPKYNPPKGMEWFDDISRMMGLVQVANTLGGRAYFEKRATVNGRRVTSFDWLLPWSISPVYNGVANAHGTQVDPTKPYGDLLGFWREMEKGRALYFTPEEVLYFWLPDYATEIGPAKNYPLAAVLANANVIANMDVFLAGYFKRGLVKAFIGKFGSDGIRPTDAETSRFKEWIRRTLMGIGNANNIELIRNDFTIETIGEGIKDLRDNALNEAEKKDIAFGMGIPWSKVDSSAGTDSNRDKDDIQFVREVVIPETTWQYRVLNEQVLNPMGLAISALPQELAIMQEDEVKRAQAFGQYVGNGMSIEAAAAILGIYLPDDIQLEKPAAPIPPALQPFAQPTPEPPGDDTIQKTAVTVLDLLDKRDEVKRFERWLKNRENVDIDEFTSAVLTDEEKADIASKAAGDEVRKRRNNDFIPPLNPEDDEISPDDPAVTEAERRFNRLFPKERGALSAAVVENA